MSISVSQFPLPSSHAASQFVTRVIAEQKCSWSVGVVSKTVRTIFLTFWRFFSKFKKNATLYDFELLGLHTFSRTLLEAYRPLRHRRIAAYRIIDNVYGQ